MKKISIFVQSALLAMLCLFVTSCASVRHNVLMGDVISFSEEATTSYTYNGIRQSDPFVIHSDKVDYDKAVVFNIKKQIMTAPSGVNTSIAYAQDLGLERIKYIRRHQLKNDKLAKYYTFILTDGLDNTSVDIARNHKLGNYKSLEAYQKKIQKKIKKLMGSGKDQNMYLVYPLLQIGADLQEFKNENFPQMTNEEFADFCRRNYMEQYRGASVGYQAPEAIVAYTFAEIKDQISDIFSSAFEFYVPKGYKGKRIKMDLVDEQGYKASFEGDVVAKGNNFYLKNIKLNDGLTVLTSSKQKKLELKAINNSDKKAIVAWFRLDNLKFGGRAYKVDRNHVKQSYATRLEGKDYYQTNSEYSKNAKPQIDAYFQLIFDTSGSIGENVKDEQDLLFEIIELITKDLKQ